MEIELKLFPETDDLNGTLADLKDLNGTIIMDTKILDGLGEEKKKEIKKEMATLLKWCGRVIILTAECEKKTGDKSVFESFMQQMVIKSRSLEEKCFAGNAGLNKKI